MPSIGSSVAALNAEVQKISQIAGIPGVANSLCDPAIIGNNSYPANIICSAQTTLPGAGGWTQIFAAIPGISKWIHLYASGALNVAGDYISLGVGPGAGEVEFWRMTTLNVGALAYTPLLVIPIRIAAGSRIAGRVQTVGSSIVVWLTIAY